MLIRTLLAKDPVDRGSAQGNLDFIKGKTLNPDILKNVHFQIDDSGVVHVNENVVVENTNVENVANVNLLNSKSGKKITNSNSFSKESPPKHTQQQQQHTQQQPTSPRTASPLQAKSLRAPLTTRPRSVINEEDRRCCFFDLLGCCSDRGDGKAV